MNERRVAVRRVGRDALPVAIIDDFDAAPEALRAAAAAATFAPGRHNYPGIRAEAPPGYLRRAAPLIAQVLRDLFGVTNPRLLDAGFAVVTAAPSTLAPVQRLPHVDALETGRIALVHYLSDDPGGTAFFRHRATGFEWLDTARSPVYRDALDAEMAAALPALAYPDAETRGFELVETISARFNRAILYASAMLHSGVITATPSPDPRAGRLTITGFFAG